MIRFEANILDPLGVPYGLPDPSTFTLNRDREQGSGTNNLRVGTGYLYNPLAREYLTVFLADAGADPPPVNTNWPANSYSGPPGQLLGEGGLSLYPYTDRFGSEE